MAKTELTQQLEKGIYQETKKQGVFGCFEVTIGWYGKERVDYITYDTKGIWRCYEIKVSKADFHSKAKKTFIGHYNYYVMPKELYDEVKDEIPNHIGVYCELGLYKRAKKQELKVDEQILKDSMIRSLYRETEKFYKTCDVNYINKLKNNINNLKKDVQENRSKYLKYQGAIYTICNEFSLSYQKVREVIRNDLGL